MRFACAHTLLVVGQMAEYRLYEFVVGRDWHLVLQAIWIRASIWNVVVSLQLPRD